jgi:ABC-2 type transport system permease protein
MLKTFLIGIKDLRLVFRDRAALILMLAAPFVLTLGLGLVTGRFSGSTSSGLSSIPVIVVNLDKEQLGNALADVFTSADLADLVEPTASSNPEAARRLIDEDKAAAVVIIPAGFTQSIMPQQPGFTSNAMPATVKIEVYANPTRPTSAGIIKAIVDEFISRVEEGRMSGMTSIMQMVLSGRITQDQADAAGLAMSKRLQTNAPDNALAIKINSSTASGETIKFDALAFIAPAMALMFLMYTVSYGGRSILAERTQGTLPRLLVSPTTSTQILGGKIFGIFLTGAAQMLILIGASSLLFQLKWGDPLGVIVLVLAAVFGATGWGMIITAIARTPSQVAILACPSC